MKHSFLSKNKAILALSICAATFIAIPLYNQKSLSASLTSVSVTLSNSRPSFRGALSANNTAGTSIVNIVTTQNAYYSTSSAQLAEGDTVRIGESGSMAQHTIGSTPSDGQFTITSTLAAGDADSGDDVISTQSATLTVRFSTANAINDGRFRILVPSLTDNGASSDGIPDGGEFDFGTSAPTVTCPSDLSGYDFVAGTASASAVTVSGQDYHSFECAYSGNGGVGTDFDGSANDAIVINSLINPAPDAGHTSGTADRYSVIVQHMNNAFSVTDSTTVNIGVIEAVKVTATVAPQITFRIIGVASSASACGITTSVTTTPTLVPFGDLVIDSFTYAAQTLTVSTNAENGYSVTAVANDQLGKDGGACTGDPTISTDTSCIQDSRGDDAGMSDTGGDDWSDTGTKGFGYTLDNSNSVSGLTPAFEYDSATGNCGGGIDCYRQFADAEDSEAAVTLYSATGPSDNHNLLVCYKAIISSIQAAGNYENYITYTATATF